MTYAHEKIPEEQADQTECKNGFAQTVIAVTEFLLPGNRRLNY